MPPIDPDLLLIAALAGTIGIALVVDLRPAHEPADETRRAVVWTCVWIGLALAFGAALMLTRGVSSGVEYATAYLVEYSLSLDNVFLFTLVFGAFAVPPALRSHLLLLGVLGALVMRLAMIVAGVTVIERFGWVLPLFGVLLVATAVRMALARRESPSDPGQTVAVRLVRRLLPVTGYEGGRLLVRRSGRLTVTPLLLALIVIESGDLVFAIDSIPAAFGVTTDPLVLYSSNAFAVLGLRSLAVVVAEATTRLRFLKLGLAGVLAFVGVKLLLSDVVHVPPVVMLGVVIGMLGTAVVGSRLVTPRTHGQPAEGSGDERVIDPDRDAPLSPEAARTAIPHHSPGGGTAVLRVGDIVGVRSEHDLMKLFAERRGVVARRLTGSFLEVRFGSERSYFKAEELEVVARLSPLGPDEPAPRPEFGGGSSSGRTGDAERTRGVSVPRGAAEDTQGACALIDARRIEPQDGDSFGAEA